MPAHKKTIRYEARQRLTDAVVVRRSLVRHGKESSTTEDILGRYTTMSAAQLIVNALNDARHEEVHHA